MQKIKSWPSLCHHTLLKVPIEIVQSLNPFHTLPKTRAFANHQLKFNKNKTNSIINKITI
jgi:hypothetical protein